MAGGRNREYKDLNLNFEPNPVTGDIDILTEEDAVKRSIRNLILTNNYERFFQPKIGSGIRNFLFENYLGPITEEKIKTSVESVITTFEPRADLIDVEVDYIETDDSFRVNIIFNIISLLEPVSVTVFLERVR